MVRGKKKIGYELDMEIELNFEPDCGTVSLFGISDDEDDCEEIKCDSKIT